MITTILDNDLYKFTMQQAVCQLYPDAEVGYKFIDRGSTSYPEGFAEALQMRVDAMEDLALTAEEQKFLRHNCPYFTPFYLSYLRGYRFLPSDVCIRQHGGNLTVTVTGPWFRTILWEVPLLAMISELYFIMDKSQKKDSMQKIADTATAKLKRFEDMDIRFADFGTRRRYSWSVHDLVISIFVNSHNFMGSSNLAMCQRHGLKPSGTQAHEWFMFHGARFGYKMANKLALSRWADVYKGALGIALTDTYETGHFLTAFDGRMSRLYDGLRHDSGDPITFTKEVISHYMGYRIDPRSKTIVYSDGLNLDKIRAIEYWYGRPLLFRPHRRYGVGTYLTNDVGVTPRNIVIKMSRADNRPCVKLSDDKGKATGYAENIKLCKDVLKRKGGVGAEAEG